MTATEVPPRKYALIRIAAGDYLLPSNDGKTFWRIAKHLDGPSLGLDWPRDLEFWGYWKWTERFDVRAAIDPDNWEHWTQWDGNYDTRRAAINAALREQT